MFFSKVERRELEKYGNMDAGLVKMCGIALNL